MVPPLTAYLCSCVLFLFEHTPHRDHRELDEALVSDKAAFSIRNVNARTHRFVDLLMISHLGDPRKQDWCRRRICTIKSSPE